MPGWLFAVIAVGVAVVAVAVIRRTQRGAFVDRLSVEDGGELQVVVPFPEKGEVGATHRRCGLFTPQATRYLEAIK